MDQYLKVENTVSRLIREYEEHASLVIAYDFDNTDYDYYQGEHTYHDAMDILRDLKEMGSYLIIITANEDYKFIKKYCAENNILLDDRADLRAAYDSLRALIKRTKSNNYDKSTFVD